jgi:hypothetical protein
MNESHIQSAESEIQSIKERILEREKTITLLKIQNDTDKKAVKLFQKGLVKLRNNADKPQ